MLTACSSLIKVDVEDIPSTLPSRNASPVLSETKKESDSPKDGNSSEVKELFKKAKQVAEVPEFDASAFGFVFRDQHGGDLLSLDISFPGSDAHCHTNFAESHKATFLFHRLITFFLLPKTKDGFQIFLEVFTSVFS